MDTNQIQIVVESAIAIAQVAAANQQGGGSLISSVPNEDLVKLFSNGVTLVNTIKQIAEYQKGVDPELWNKISSDWQASVQAWNEATKA